MDVVVNGKKALEYLATATPDLILSDIMMPGKVVHAIFFLT